MNYATILKLSLVFGLFLKVSASTEEAKVPQDQGHQGQKDQTG
jgi:hypothetical protein